MARVQSGKFLVVDDEDVWRRTGVHALSPFGEVVTARTRPSPRETEIVAGAVTGLPRRLIAEQLGVSENTLKVQIRHLLLKCSEPSLDALSDTVLRRAFGAALQLGAPGDERPSDSPAERRDTGS